MSIHPLAEAGYLVIEPFVDTLEEPHWMRADGDDLLKFVTPILGPTATLIVHRAASYFAQGDTWLQFDILDLALTFGLGSQLSRHAPLSRAIERIDRFGFGQLDMRTPTLRVRTAIPPIPRRQAERIPGYLSEECPYIVR